MSTADDLALADLERSGISIKDAETAGFVPVADAATIYEDFQELPALLIPYYDPITQEPLTFERDGELLPFARVRYLAETQHTKGFVKRKAIRYSQPVDSGVHAYFPVVEGLNWQEVFDDVEIPIVITEGEKKAVVSCLAGIPTIGLGGVYNFMRGDSLLPSIDSINMDGRSVYICYDSDAASNANIQAAEGKLATELSLTRNADVFLGRLPAIRGNDKTGIDDFIVSKGSEAFIKVLEAAPQMRKIDAAVLGLNKSVAWIEDEGLVYDIETGKFIKKHDFTRGSRFSALEIIVPSMKGPGTKRISVAEEWLTHAHATRYQEVLFRPDSEDSVITTPKGGRALNLWTGWEPDPGDVTPFLELTKFLFSDLPEDQQDIPLKLVAYKAQNPGAKIPLALVLLGTQGCGKSFWAQIVRQAFSPYGDVAKSGALTSDFNAWVEKSLICVIDEAQSVHLSKGADVLKNLITDKRQMLNDKYRAVRQVDSFTFYILTSNDRRVGSYSSDDRRMFVISAPRKREKVFYDKIKAWNEEGHGPKKLLHWLLAFDLQGWTPPAEAPMTAEKYMAYVENLTPVQRLAEEMQTADENVIKMWIDQSIAWCKTAEVGDNRTEASQANEIKTALSRFQIRPFYTPEELAMMFPAIVAQLHGFKSKNTPAGEISRTLRESGISYLRCRDNPRGFRHHGMLKQFLVIAQPEEWSVSLTQDEFDRYMKHFPTYGTLTATN